MKIDKYFFLIVEDEFIASEFLAQILRDMGAQNIIKARSAQEALQAISEQKIDLAFMDINLEGNIDGIECARLLNKEEFVPTLFTTAYGDSNTIEEAQSKYIIGYLIKPFLPNDVEASCRVALSLLELKKELTKIEKPSGVCKNMKDLGEGYVYYFTTQTLSLQDKSIDLTKKELEVLNIFCKNANINLSYRTIKENVWRDKNVSDSTLRDIISRLKRKVPHLNIQNITNFGYILKE